MPGFVYHPRIACKIIVPAVGLPQTRETQQGGAQTYTLNVRPTRVRLVANNYNEADECDITGTYDEMGLDPRYLRSAEGYVWIGDGDTSGEWTPTFDQLRFVGIARDISREFGENGGKVVHIKMQDYTCLFLEAKTYPANKYPPFSATLRQAWELICDNTGYWDLDTHTCQSSVQALKKKLFIFQGSPNDGEAGSASETAEGPTLGSAIPPRLAKLGKLQIKGEPDAWAIWRTCCESLGLITFIRGNRCIVTTASDFYTAGDSPRLIYGQNVKHLRESRDLGTLSSKWICVRSYDPLAGCSTEAFFPDPSLAPRKKKLAASAAKNGTSIKAQDFECFDLPFACSDQTKLTFIAERIWQERTRQEIRGSLHTSEMTVPTVRGQQFDLLSLAAGDQVQVEIAREALDNVQSITTIAGRIDALQARGYSSDMANFIANNLDSITSLPPQFLVHSVEHEIDWAAHGGTPTYKTQIEFLNRIDISQQSTESGAAVADGGGTAQPALVGQTLSAARQSVQPP